MTLPRRPTLSTGVLLIKRQSASHKRDGIQDGVDPASTRTNNGPSSVTILKVASPEIWLGTSESPPTSQRFPLSALLMWLCVDSPALSHFVLGPSEHRPGTFVLLQGSLRLLPLSSISNWPSSVLALSRSRVWSTSNFTRFPRRDYLKHGDDSTLSRRQTRNVHSIPIRLCDVQGQTCWYSRLSLPTTQLIL